MDIDQSDITELFKRAFEETLDEIPLVARGFNNGVLKKNQIQNEMDFYIGYTIAMIKERFLLYAQEERFPSEKVRIALPSVIDDTFKKIDLIRNTIREELTT
ncbi:MAG: hypothetical protein ACPKQO_07840 [Nitrososphaeraceae archaeon]